MINYQTITIDLQPDYREPVVQMYLSERDVGRPIQVNVLMQGQPYSFTAGTTVHIDLRKPSGRVVQVNGNYAVGSNVVLFNVVEQMAAEPGMCLTELSIVGDGQDPIGSKNWLTKVELSPMHAGDPSETWIEDLDELVQDAMEGHIDATLSIPGDAADAAAVGEELADLKSAIDWEKINGWTEGRYIKTSGSTCDPSALITSPTYRTVVLDCVAGENFTINGTGGHDPRLWAFIDAENNVLIKADAATTASDLIITAPSDATKLILNSTNWSVDCYRGITPQAQDKVLEGHIRDAVALVGTPLAGILPTTLGNYYPEIDTEAQTFTIWNDSILFDRRLNADGYFAITSKIVVSYASIVSTAIAFWWDIDNATVYPARFGLVRDPKKFILIALFRKNKSAIASSTPIVIDGKINGAFDPAAFSALQNDKLWANNIVKSINHRGYSNIAPENTLPAFQMSKAKGYKYVETDVQFTSDDVAVLLHDASINRTARNNDGTELSSAVNIADITYAQALQYDFGIWKGAAYAGTRIPTFEEFVVACKRLGLHPYIEMKVGTESQIASLYNTVKKCGMTGEVTWISYNTALLGYITALGETERVGYISSTISATRIESATALRTGKNEVFLDADNASAVTDEGVNLLISANLPLEVFTIGASSIIALSNYVSGITNNADNVGEILYENYNTQSD